jgi:nucleoside-diphosphate-sugar epimerase
MAQIKTILITGATGNIGRVLCHQLNEKFEVRTGVRRHVENLPNPVLCPIDDFPAVLQAMQGVDAVIHLAAQAWDGDFYTKMIPNNITGCYNIFEAARQAEVKRVIFASTHHVVGLYLKEGITVDEDVPVRPDNLYAATKVFGEALARLYAEQHGLSVISARIGWYLTPKEFVDVQPPDWKNWAWTMWISPRDMEQFMTRCLEAKNIGYETLNCISHNTRKLLDLTRAKTVLGYVPQDNAETLIEKFGLDQK